MNPPRFDRFAQPQYLQHLGRERLIKLLTPFASELLNHGILLNAPTLPDDAFFVVLATLPRQVGKLSERLLDMMTAIEVMDEVYPDERAPMVVSELRFRLRSTARPILISPTGEHGSFECEVVPGQGNQEVRIQKSECSTTSEDVPRPTTEVAQAAFALLAKLDVEGKHKAPSALTVFRLYCIEGLSADRVARQCRCAKGTVMARLRFIETQTRTRPEQFRAMSGHLQRMADDYETSGAREIYRRGLTGSAPDEDRDSD